MLRGVSCLIVLLLAAACGPVTTGICGIPDHRADLDGKSVRVSGSYFVGNQVAFFRDERCPEVEVGVIVPRGEPSRERFMDEVWAVGPHPPIRELPIEVTGTFHARYDGRSDVIVADKVVLRNDR